MNWKPSDIAMVKSLGGGSGGGGGGVTPNIQATAETLPAGSTAAVTRTGSNANPVFHFGIPQGIQGDPGPGLPPGGAVGQIPVKASAADYDVQWEDAPQNTLSPDETITIEGRTISVANPVRGIYTQAEFDALTEAKKASGTYFVDDNNVSDPKLLRVFSNGKALGLPVGPRGPAGPDGNPIGSIISYMGLTAPKDYLICDGATYPITDYPDLADFFQDQFGSKNYFGGDGTNTFAVPDMRNLFLRGYHGEATKQMSSDVGVKQEGTKIPFLAVGSNMNINFNTQGKNIAAWPLNSDEDFISNCMGRYINATGTWSGASPDLAQYYSSRPVNMAVLYCIKAAESLPSGNVYSLEEQMVGRWINGKPLYKRTMIQNTIVPKSDTQTVLLNTSTYQIDVIIKYELFSNGLFDTSLGQEYYYNDGNQYLVQYGNIVYYSQHFTQGHVGKNFTIYYTIYYTKTTDTPTIELPAMLTAKNAERFSIDTLPIQAASVTAEDAEIRNDGAETMNDYAEIRNEEV